MRNTIISSIITITLCYLISWLSSVGSTYGTAWWYFPSVLFSVLGAIVGGLSIIANAFIWSEK